MKWEKRIEFEKLTKLALANLLWIMEYGNAYEKLEATRIIMAVYKKVETES